MIKNRLLEYFSNRRHRTSTADVLRLVGVLIIAFAAIVCIALDKERIYFTNVLTFIVGVIVDSPITTSHAATAVEEKKEGAQ